MSAPASGHSQLSTLLSASSPSTGALDSRWRRGRATYRPAVSHGRAGRALSDACRGERRIADPRQVPTLRANASGHKNWVPHLTERTAGGWRKTVDLPDQGLDRVYVLSLQVPSTCGRTPGWRGQRPRVVSNWNVPYASPRPTSAPCDVAISLARRTPSSPQTCRAMTPPPSRHHQHRCKASTGHVADEGADTQNYLLKTCNM